jgi:hypothetical protein
VLFLHYRIGHEHPHAGLQSTDEIIHVSPGPISPRAARLGGPPSPMAPGNAARRGSVLQLVRMMPSHYLNALRLVGLDDRHWYI